MKAKLAIPLFLVLLVASVAVPLAHDLTTTAPSPGLDQPAMVEEGAGDGEGTTATEHELARRQAARDAPVEALVQRLSQTGHDDGELLSRLRPLLNGAPSDVEPRPVPTNVGLVAATLGHPLATDRDRAYAMTLAPTLPTDLDHSLGRIVTAHATATSLVASGAPDATAVGAATLTNTLDQEMSTLERYVGHPVWDQDPSAPQAPTPTLSTPPLEVALLDLYGALGLAPETLDALAPQVDAATTSLPPEVHGPVATLVAATAQYQQAVMGALPVIAATTSHEEPGDENATLQAVDDAKRQVRAAAEQVRATLEGASGGTPLESPWTDPLGLVVVGTPGNDTFDAKLGGDPETREQVRQVGNLTRELLGTLNQTVNASLSQVPLPTGSPEGTLSAEAVADLSKLQEGAPAPGWHMIVVDPGGDDVYHNNAGGIDAGAVRLEVSFTDTASAQILSDTLTDERGRVCLPFNVFCEPAGAGSLVQVLLRDAGTSAFQSATTGFPLAALVVDVQGNDTYLDTGEVIQGAARGLAFGLLLDAEGDDAYTATEMAQGASEDWGTGALMDLLGHDTYAATARAQGWARVPEPNVTVESWAFFGDSRVPTYLARHVHAQLVDLDGHDAYHTGDLLTSQGLTVLPQGFVHRAITETTYVDNHVLSASLIDIGGPERLGVPVVDQEDGQPFVHRPSSVNVSGWRSTEAWVARNLDWPPSFAGHWFFPSLDMRWRYKTALHATTDNAPDLAGDATLRVGQFNVSLYENGPIIVFLLGLGSLSIDQDLLLFGQPGEVQDPPLLTVTFGGDTAYAGAVAASGDRREDPPGDDEQDVGFFCSTGSDCLASANIPDPSAPALLVDLNGTDTYTGPNATIGYASHGGLALLIDREGDDVMEAGPRSIAYARDARSLAVVLDMDGHLTAQAGNRSLAFATDRSSSPTVSASMPPTALLDLGARSITQDGARMVGGNQSLAFSEGRGIALLVGGGGNDAYHAGGWGLGMHDGLQLLEKFCDAEVDGAPLVVERTIRQLHLWAGGVAAVVDQAGNDVYSLGSRVGLGDVRTSLSKCFETQGPTHVSVLGLGLLLDVAGSDEYHLVPVPERPEALYPRGCSGDDEQTCVPGEDRAWVVTGAGHATTLVGGSWLETPQSLGLGIDNVRNAHHAVVALCRAYDPIRSHDDGNFWDPEAAECGPQTQMVGALLASPLSPQRTPEIEVAAPVMDDPSDQGQGRHGDQYDYPELFHDVASLPREALEATAPGAGLDPGVLFINDTVLPVCRTPFDSTIISAQEPHDDHACITIKSDTARGTWIGHDPARDPADPGDTVSCNCSAQVSLSPVQNGTVDLATLAGNVYPSSGNVTTQTLAYEPWYNAHSRFRFPAKVGPGLVPSQTVDPSTGEVDAVTPSAEFPIRLDALPQGLAKVRLNITVDDALSEESGGLVPPAKLVREDFVLVHERPFQQAFVRTNGDSQQLFLVAPGPVSDETEVEIDPGLNLTEDLVDSFEDAGWSQVGGILKASLPDRDVIDGPARSPVVPLAGPQACAALLLEEATDGGSCWTGMELVVALALPNEIDAAAIQQAEVDDGDDTVELAVALVSSVQGDAEPRVRFATPEPYGISTFGDVHGVPGSLALDEGRTWAEAFLGERVQGAWGIVQVEAGGEAPEGIAPANLGTAHPYESLAVKVWYYSNGLAPRFGDPVVVEGQPVDDPDQSFDGPVHVTLPCTFLPYNPADRARERLLTDGDVIDRDDSLRPTACVAWSDGQTLSYAMPLGLSEGPRIVELGAEVLSSEGEATRERLAVHIDPLTPRGQLLLDETATRSTTVNATLRMFGDSFTLPRLDGGTPSDLVSATLQARPEGGNWTTLDDQFETLPTLEDPEVATQLHLGSLVNGSAAQQRIQLRTLLVDESNNTNATSPSVFVVDRRAPQVEQTVLERGEGIDELTLRLDEDALLACGDDRCTVRANVTIPGAEIEPLLDLERVGFGTRSLSIPVANLLHGVPYVANLTLVDALGNERTVEVELPTQQPFVLDASATAERLVNRTVTLDWRSEHPRGTALKTTTNAYLLTEDTACPILTTYPAVVVPGKPQSWSVGPLPQSCDIGGEGVEGRILLYSLVHAARAISYTEVPVLVDDRAPSLTLEVPHGWVNGTTTVAVNATDHLEVTTELTLDGRTRAIGSQATVPVSGEGIHNLTVRATDAAGNRVQREAQVRIDETPPTVSGTVVGRHGGLALVEVSASDTLAGVDTVQLATSSGAAGPAVPVVAGEPVLLSAVTDANDTGLQVLATDTAGNTASTRLDLSSATSDVAGVGGLTLTALGPDRVQVRFTTPEAVAPVVLAEGPATHLERVLPHGTDHNALLTGLAPGKTVRVTIGVAQDDQVVPVVERSITLPADTEAPGPVEALSAKAVPGGVQLTWTPPADDVGLEGVVIERDGQVLATTRATQFIDRLDATDEATYRLAPVDLAGNLGPWTEVRSTPQPEVRILDVRIDPQNATPETPITVQARVAYPQGSTPDLVMLETWASEIAMEPVSVSDGESLYAVTLRLPALNVTVEDPRLLVHAQAAGATDTARADAPLVSLTAPASIDGGQADLPGPGVLVTLLLATLLAATRRRWTR